ncbi:MAG: SulP family inorganic anion transporter [Parachlamydiales bacterium]
MSAEITLLPFLRDFPKWRGIAKDLLASLSIALIALPQALAYAFVADLPLVVGVATAIYGTLFCALFGASRHLVSGPTNTIAILLLSAVGGIVATHYGDLSPAERHHIAFLLAIQATLMIGILQIGAALFGLGKLAQFVSRPVVKGYVCGAAIAVIVSQLPVFMGIPSPSQMAPLYVKLLYIFRHLPEAHLMTVAVGAGSLVTLIVLRRVIGRAYAALIVFGLAILIGWAFDLGVSTVASAREMGGALGRPAPPYFDFRLIGELLPVAFAISLLGALEVTAIVKSLGGKTGQPPNLSQEVFGLGIANLLSSFFGAMPSSGSFARSTINFEAGGTSRWAALFSAPLVALLYFGLGQGIGAIPLATFAALLFTTAGAMVDRREMYVCVKATRGDRIALVATFASCLLFSLSTAFYVGVILSVIVYLRKAATPMVIEVGVGSQGEIRPTSLLTPHPHVKVIDVEGELFFGAVDFFQRAFEALATDAKVRAVILRLKNAHHFDATTCLALRHVHHYLEKQGISLLLCGVSEADWRVLSRSGLSELIGSENLFPNDTQDVLGSMRRAFARAESLTDV